MFQITSLPYANCQGIPRLIYQFKGAVVFMLERCLVTVSKNGFVFSFTATTARLQAAVTVVREYICARPHLMVTDRVLLKLAG